MRRVRKQKWQRRTANNHQSNANMTKRFITLVPRRLLLPSVIVFALLAGSNALAEDNGDALGCPVLRHGYGPFDYRNATPGQLLIVEGAHFFPNVENLRKGTMHPHHDYIVIPGAEIDYTLRAYPNHPRALVSLMRLGELEHSERPSGVKAPIRCYFQSAVTFRPDDSMVRAIYGIYLSKKGRTEDAITQLKKAEELGADGPSMYYNLGLGYFAVKRYPEALEAAHKAYARGFPLPGLRTMLQKVGAWKDPAPQAVVDSDAPLSADSPQVNQGANAQPQSPTNGSIAKSSGDQDNQGTTPATAKPPQPAEAIK